MNVSIILAKPGMGIEEGTIVCWLKAVGDLVQQGEVIAEVETAKAIQEVESPATGTLTHIIANVGTTVAVNAEIGILETSNA